MEITKALKKRFCKDCNIPINIFDEPYFMDRLKLYDTYYGTLAKWERFNRSIFGFESEQQYFEEYNRAKDEAIEDIKASEGYKRFNETDMSKFSIKNVGLPRKDIFKESNDGRTFISVDMIKANFTALQTFDTGIFNHKRTWEEFITQYADNEHIIHSKYIRQVILGNCNPKRHITYEKYLMDTVLTYITEAYLPMERVVFFSNDEIVFDITDMPEPEGFTKAYHIQNELDRDFGKMFSVEKFTLHKIGGIGGFYKEIDAGEGYVVEFKCLDSYKLPFVIRAFKGEEVTDSDRTFFHEGYLARYIEDIEISL